MNSYKDLKAKYEAFAYRERLLIWAAFVGIACLLMDLLLLQPVSQELAGKSKLKSQLQHTLTTKEAEIKVLSSVSKNDPLKKLQSELSVIERDIVREDQRLADLSAGFVDAKDLPDVLHDVLKQNKHLKLSSLRTLPAQRIVLSDENDSVKQVEAPKEKQTSDALSVEENIEIYKQGVELRFQGEFRHTAQYLKDLEAGKWKFYWDRLSYKVTRYPYAEVVLVVHTISGGKGVFVEY